MIKFLKFDYVFVAYRSDMFHLFLSKFCKKMIIKRMDEINCVIKGITGCNPLYMHYVRGVNMNIGALPSFTASGL
jgi:hypothetical protein